KLELKNYLKPYTCDGCKERGFGPRYRCEKCDFDLHRECMFPQTSPFRHEFFPGSTFKFLRTPPKACHDHCKLQCEACRMDINGFVYHCKEDDLDLHPCCRKLEKEYRVKEDDEEMVFNLDKKVRGKCMWCKRKSIKEGDHSNGWSYISECRKYHIHVACATQMVLEEWKQREDCIKYGDDQKWALEKMNLKAIRARGHGHGGRGNKCWRILKIFIQTIVSIVLGDPTMTLASLFIELIAP
ncbi:uncharacterized protein LOC111006137, partial [Momordica charantia]|uniref:Uncharacterized protein LOC111006137 n=1 Tax=Momordica charantia TaxID=3673 RepID=A0A6J1BZK4_MOMCH